MSPLPPFTRFDGQLNAGEAGAFLVLASGVWLLMMLDNPPTGVFSDDGVVQAANHFFGVANGTAVSVRGFVQQDDVDGTGNLQSVLHFDRDLNA